MARIQTWKCDVCGYVHHGAEPPAQCPVCGVGAEMFSPFEVVAVGPQAATSAFRCTVCGFVHAGQAPPATCPVCGAGRDAFVPVQPEEARPQAGKPVEQVLILGGGIAAVTAAEHARRVAPGASIAIVSKEPGLPYYRLNLTRFLAGEVDESQLDLQAEAWYRDQRIELVPGEAVAIERQERRVQLRDGRSLGYDRLVFGLGAHVFVPPIPGVTKHGVSAVRTLADARELLGRVRPGQRVICLGGGLLGLEIAGALGRRGARPIVLEGFPSLLPRQLAAPAGDLLEAHLGRVGIEVRCNVRVEEVVGDEDVAGVRLAGNETVPAEGLVLATGIRPNSYLARQSGIAVEKGILVDDAMRTSDEAIYAAGDVAEHRGVLYGIWPTAYAQGVVAGVNAAGGEARFTGVPPSNRLKVLDVDLFSIGVFQPPDGSFAVVEEQRGGTYARLVCRDGALVGANLYGDTRLAPTVKTAVEEGTQLVEVPELLDRFPDLKRLCFAAGPERKE